MLPSTLRLFFVHRAPTSCFAGDTVPFESGLSTEPTTEIEADAGENWSIRIADFERSILEQLHPADDVIILEWGLDAPDARGVLDAVTQQVPGARVLVITGDVPADDPIDRGADEYLVGPVSSERFHATVEQLALQTAYEEAMTEYFRLATERALLENERAAGVDVAERYERVTAELRECRERAGRIRRAFSREGFDRTLRRLLGE